LDDFFDEIADDIDEMGDESYDFLTIIIGFIDFF
jgi:hypothetical protein